LPLSHQIGCADGKQQNREGNTRTNYGCDDGSQWQTAGRVNGGQCDHGRGRSGSSGKHDERAKRAWRHGIITRWRCLSHVLVAPRHIETHVSNDQPSHDPEYIQRNAEDGQNFEADEG
jgi:hypothetical protein